jgi:hypothetical protein
LICDCSICKAIAHIYIFIKKGARMKQVKKLNTLLFGLLICAGNLVIGEFESVHDNLKPDINVPDQRSLYQRFQESKFVKKAKNFFRRNTDNQDIEEREKINLTDRKDGLTALHIAAREGSLPETKRLLNLGAHVDAKDANGKTALHYAAQNGHFKIVQELLAHGALVDQKDNDGNTPLHLAYYAKQNHDYNEQVRAGGNITIQAPYKHYHKQTAPGQAYDYGVIKNLINAGAKEDIKNNQREVPGYVYYKWVDDDSEPFMAHFNTEARRDIKYKTMSLDRSTGVAKNMTEPTVKPDQTKKVIPSRQAFIDSILND